LGDEELVQAMEHGLTAQLQRTKDGATAQSRITELAGRSSAGTCCWEVGSKVIYCLDAW
jgi:hypothetical protein